VAVVTLIVIADGYKSSVWVQRNSQGVGADELMRSTEKGLFATGIDGRPKSVGARKRCSIAIDNEKPN
jgi:hypothetical protein